MEMSENLADLSSQAERHRATLQALIEHHEEQAAKLVEVKPKGDGA
jgi:hypothetical protein